jgi:hypothetical protein
VTNSQGGGFDPYLDFLQFYRDKLTEINQELNDLPTSHSARTKVNFLYKAVEKDIENRKRSHNREASKRDF